MLPLRTYYVKFYKIISDFADGIVVKCASVLVVIVELWLFIIVMWRVGLFRFWRVAGFYQQSLAGISGFGYPNISGRCWLFLNVLDENFKTVKEYVNKLLFAMEQSKLLLTIVELISMAISFCGDEESESLDPILSVSDSTRDTQDSDLTRTRT